MLGIIRPTVSGVVLAASVDVRVEEQHRAAVLQAWGFVVAVAENHVRGGQVVQSL